MPLFKERRAQQKAEAELEVDNIYNSIKKGFRKSKSKQRRFSWKGLGNLLGTIAPPGLGDSFRAKRVKDLSENNAKATEKDYIDAFEDLEKGIYGVAENVSYSIGDLATSGIDAVSSLLPVDAQTNLNERLDKLYEENKMQEPEMFISKATEVLGTYGLPGGAVFKIGSRLNKLSKLKTAKAYSRLKLGKKVSSIARKAGSMAGLFGATDFIAATPDTPTLFMNPENTENLSGRERVAAKFRNRLRYAAEGATVGGGFALAGKPIALGFKYGLVKPVVGTAKIGLKGFDNFVVQPASYLLSKDKYVIPRVSKVLRNTTGYTLEKVIAPALIGKLPIVTRLPEFKKWAMFSVNSADPLQGRLKKLDNVLSWFSSRGNKTGLDYKITTRAQQEIKAQARTIEKYLEDIEKRAYNLAKGFKDDYATATTSPSKQDQYLNQVLGYFKKEIDLNQLPKTLRQPAKELDQELIKAKQKFADLLPEGELKQYLLDNVQKYMRKSFAVFTNPEFKPNKQVFDGATDWFVQLIKNNRDLRTQAGNTEQGIRNFAEILTKTTLRNGLTDGGDPLRVLQKIARKNLRMDKQIRTGEELPDAIKRLLGEENNFKSSVLTTTSHAVTQATNKKMADRLAAAGVKEGWLFKSKEAAQAAGVLDVVKVVAPKSLGLLSTRLERTYGSAQIAEALQGVPGKLDNLIQNGAYRSLLQFKVATQFGKTVLSPATQVRNVTSASLFPLANGQLGGRASVTDAFKIVMDDIFGAGKEVNTQTLIKSIENKIRLGVIDENIVASELGAVLKEIKKGSINSLDGLYNKLTNGKFMKEATRLYAGGDNLWKWYGHEYAKSQMRSIYKNVDDIATWTKEVTGQNYIKRDLITKKLKTFDEAVDEAAAWYIRNTYPTYSKVPPAIQAIRKLPFGNFVSFPAEMIRTSFNIVDIGAKEIASNNPLLRQMGYRRLMGASFTMGGAGTAALNIASFVTGTPLEQLEAYKRSFAAPWNSSSTIIPINNWKGGVGKAVNFSYFSPYNVIQQPIEAAIARGKLSDRRGGEDFTRLKMSFAAVKTLAQPFMSEAIALERLTDVIPAGFATGGRGGVTKTGSSVYSETDSDSDKFYKGFAHILKGVEPGLVTTGRKILAGAKDDLTKSGTPVNLRDEMLALFSGIRIINVDAPKAYNYKLTDFNQKKRAVTKSENFYNTKNIQTRGGSVIADEFRKIQDEAFRVQQDFYNVVQDALALGVKKQVLKKANKKRLSNKDFGKILRGKFTPFKYSVDRFRKRINQAKKAFSNEVIDRNFVFPRRLLNQVIREYRNKSLKPEVKQESKTIAPTRSNVPVRKIASTGLARPTVSTQPATNNTTPAKITTATAQTNPITNLTRTETALLSPSEQEIARRT